MDAPKPITPQSGLSFSARTPKPVEPPRRPASAAPEAPARPSSPFVMDISREAMALLRVASRLLANAAGDPALRALAERVLAQSREAIPPAEDSAPQGAAAAPAAEPQARVPAALLREVLAALADGRRRLDQPLAARIEVPLETILDILEALRAGGGEDPLIRSAQDTLQSARPAPNGRVEIPGELLTRLTDAVSRVAGRIIGEQTAGGRPISLPPPLEAFVREALAEAQRLLAPSSTPTAMPPPVDAAPATQSPQVVPSPVAPAASEGTAASATALRQRPEWLALVDSMRAPGAPITATVSTDLLQSIAESIRASGGSPALATLAEALAAQGADRGAGVAVGANALQALMAEVERLAAPQRTAPAPALPQPPAGRAAAEPYRVQNTLSTAAAIERAYGRTAPSLRASPVASGALAAASVTPQAPAASASAASSMPAAPPTQTPASPSGVSVDLLQAVAAALRASGGNPALAAAIEDIVAQAGPRTAEAAPPVAPEMARLILTEIEQAAGRALAEAGSAPEVRLSAALYQGAIAALAIASEGRPTASASALSSSSSSPPTAEAVGRAATAIGELVRELAAGAPENGGEPAAEAALIRNALNAVARLQPALAQQAALALTVYARIAPTDPRLGLAQAVEFLNRLAESVAAEPASALSPRPSELSLAAPLQVELEAAIGAAPRIRTLVAELRSLGAHVDAQPAEGRPGVGVLRITLGANEPGPPAVLDLRPAALAPLGAEEAIRSLMAAIAPQASRAPGLPRETQTTETFLRSLMDADPQLARPLAIALQAAAAAASPPELRAALGRANAVLAQVLLAIRPAPSSPQDARSASRTPAGAFIIQVLLNADPARTASMEDAFRQLRALGVEVAVREAAGPQGKTEIAIAIHQTGESGSREAPRAFSMDLRSTALAPMGSPDDAGRPALAHAPAERRLEAPPPPPPHDQPGQSGRGSQERERPPFHSTSGGEATRRSDEASRDRPPIASVPDGRQIDFNPLAAPPPFRAPASGGARAADQPAPEAPPDRLLLAYEPEKTLAWQIAHFREKSPARSVVRVRRGAFFEAALEEAPGERV